MSRVDERLTVVVGVTGGIAAYKAVGVVRALVLLGHSVHVVATDAALRFVGRPTLEAISRNPVETDLYDGVAEVRHVALGQSADLIVIAPATANSIAKLAGGFADDLLGTTILASSAPLVIAPAMHTEMWNNPATVANIETLRSRGIVIVGPAVGQLTGTDSGAGRMEEPDVIARAALAAYADGGSAREGATAQAMAAPSVAPPRSAFAVAPLVNDDGRGGDAAVTDITTPERARRQGVVIPLRAVRADLAGKKIVVSAGGTREPLDPVRFLGNRSSGKQGVSLARAALARGADVTLVSAHIEVAPPEGAEVVAVQTALELQQAMTAAAADADIVIMAAAVADFRPSDVRDGKIKKTETGDHLTLELIENPDILAGLASAKHDGQVVVGFAAETEPDPARLIEIGLAKLRRKKCDFLVVNSVGWHEGFAQDDNEVVVLNAAGDIVMEASGSKLSVADRILDVIA